jgi:antitoxin component YwqK of YwqJK toxin-antitoxin module
MLTLEIRKPRMIQWRTTNWFFHNFLIPAHTCWYENGQKYYESYCVNGKQHRDPNLGPAHIYWYENGQKSCEEYYVSGEEVNKPC